MYSYNYAICIVDLKNIVHISILEAEKQIVDVVKSILN